MHVLDPLQEREREKEINFYTHFIFNLTTKLTRKKYL